MADKTFKVFDPIDLGPERIIGGEDRIGLDIVPEYFEQFERLVLPSRPATVERFRQASEGRPIVIEVGSGRGRFLTAMAAAMPDAVCLGLETGLSLCGDCLNRAAGMGLDNLFMAWGDARRTIPMLVRPGTAVSAFLMFPDPWWKKRHASRRHGPLMGTSISDALAPGSRLVLKSDVEPYLAVIVQAFMSTGRYRLEPDPVGLVEGLPYTDREVRLRASDIPIFTAVLTAI